MIKYSQQPAAGTQSVQTKITPSKSATPPEPIGNDPMAEDDQEQD